MTLISTSRCLTGVPSWNGLGIDQLQAEIGEVGGVTGGQRSAVGQGHGTDHGIGGGDRPGQPFAVAPQFAISMGGLPAEGPHPACEQIGCLCVPALSQRLLASAIR